MYWKMTAKTQYPSSLEPAATDQTTKVGRNTMILLLTPVNRKFIAKSCNTPSSKHVWMTPK
jgi:hypothetical protein